MGVVVLASLVLCVVDCLEVWRARGDWVGVGMGVGVALWGWIGAGLVGLF